MQTADRLARDLGVHGLLLRGGFHPGDADDVPGTCGTLFLIGNAGGALWPHFLAGRRDEADPLDTWVRRIVDPLAASLNGRTFYPGDGPPYLPFQRWARRAEAVHPSPLGLLIHRRHGLWHAWRAAIGLRERLPLPTEPATPSPCLDCADRPCLSACPVDAFDGASYDDDACRGHLDSGAGRPCRTGGCLARHACPVGAREPYAPGQAAFHMAAFRAAKPG